MPAPLANLMSAIDAPVASSRHSIFSETPPSDLSRHGMSPLWTRISSRLGAPGGSFTIAASNGAASLRRLAPRAWMEGVVKLGALPLRTEHALLGGEIVGRADRVAASAHPAHALEVYVHDRKPGGGAFEQDLLRRGHHGEPALGMAEQVLRGHHERQVLDGARPDQRAPARPQAALLRAGRHEDQLGTAQRQSARHLRHVDLAAHGEPDPAEIGLEYRKLVARHVLEFPPRPAGVDPRTVGMGAAIARRRAAVRIG